MDYTHAHARMNHLLPAEKAMAVNRQLPIGLSCDKGHLEVFMEGRRCATGYPAGPVPAAYFPHSFFKVFLLTLSYFYRLTNTSVLAFIACRDSS
ncbi:hypothetical protein DESC_790011 [Desulfosarcina cetonica]|nr:hypothetical protein DESC_790011 [Desulfosarcina cetonica]